MVLSQLLSMAVGYGIEQLVRWRYGPMGIVALMLLMLGVRARNSTCALAGAALLFLLMAQA